MKTNHQRGFKDTRHSRAVFSKYFVGGGEIELSNLCDKAIGAKFPPTSGDHTNGKRGIAKDRRGAKKFVKSRIRFNENAATSKLAKELDND